MDSYVVRVYKREKKKGMAPEKIHGVVEDPATGLRWGFESAEQLWAIIASIPTTDNKIVKVEEKQVD